MGGETSICGSAHVSSAPVNRTTALLSPPLLLDTSLHLGTDREDSLPPREHFSAGNATALIQSHQANILEQNTDSEELQLIIEETVEQWNDHALAEGGGLLPLESVDIRQAAKTVRLLLENDAADAGPHSHEKVAIFRSRHYQAAEDTVSKIFERLDQANPLNEEQKTALDSVKSELQELSKKTMESILPLEKGQGSVFEQLKPLVGGRDGIKRGWIRCIMNRNARRARSIQKRAENGESFESIYAGNKLRNIHPKAALALYLRGRLKRIGQGGEPWAQTQQLAKELSKEYLRLTQSSNAWSTYSHRHSSFSIKVPRKNNGLLEEKNLGMVSTQAPASEIPALRQTFQKGVRGISSMNSKESQHATNLWKTEFKPAPGSEAKVSFAGFRHGVLDAYGIKPGKADLKDASIVKEKADERAAANINKASELVRAAATEMSGLMKKNADGSWSIPIVSVSLQTAGYRGDGEMIAGQDQAWGKLQEDGVQMEGPNPDGEQKPWTLKPDCLRFFIGVNPLALILPIRNTSAGHWRSEFGSKNEAAIDALLVAEVPPASQNDNDTLLKVKLIEELRNQIRSIKADQSYREVGAEPYKLAVRVLLLASLIGRVPCFNCKSGKDRTGVLDVEIKALVQTINENIARHGMDSETRLVPQYNQVRSEEQKRVFKDLHLHGGSQEVSYANTGLVGNKTSVANYMRENLDENTLKQVAGFGRHADGNK